MAHLADLLGKRGSKDTISRSQQNYLDKLLSCHRYFLLKKMNPKTDVNKTPKYQSCNTQKDIILFSILINFYC